LAANRLRRGPLKPTTVVIEFVIAKPAKSGEGFGDNTLWIITEAARSVTIFLLPREH
jgi:hypothetical protein